MKLLEPETVVGYWGGQDRQILNAVHGVEAATRGVLDRARGRGRGRILRTTPIRVRTIDAEAQASGDLLRPGPMVTWFWVRFDLR